MSLREKAIGASRWKITSSAFRAILQIAQVIILTKLLDKSDYGLMAICLMISSLMRPFIDLGTENSIIYKQEARTSQLSTILWLKILVSLFLYGIIYIASPWIAEFYGEPSLVLLIRLATLSFILTAINTHFATMLRRELGFNVISSAEIVSQVISLGVAISMAFNGMGVFSLIGAYLTMHFVQVVILVWYGTKIHTPTLVLRIGLITEYLKFGLYQTPQNFVFNISQQIDVLLIGKFMGTDTLGLYSLARTLILRPSTMLLPAISNVALPVLSKIKDSGALKRAAMNILNVTASSIFPIFLCIAALSEDIVLLVYGAKWIEAAPYVFLFSWYMVFRVVKILAVPLLVSKGKIKESFLWTVSTSLASVVGISLGMFHSVELVITNLIIIEIVLIVFFYLYIMKPLVQLPVQRMITDTLRPILFCMGYFIAAMLFSPLIDVPFYMIFIVGAIGSVVYLFLSYTYNGEFIKVLLDFIRIRAGKKATVNT